MLKWSGLGMGIGGYGTISTSDVQKYYNDLNLIKSLGFTHVRVGSTDVTFGTAITVSQLMAQYAKSIGLFTIWGVTNVFTLTASNYPNYDTSVQSFASWAQTNNIDQFEIGNELESTIDNTTLTQTGLITNLKATAVKVQGIFTNGNVSYGSTGGSTWVNNFISAGITPGTDFDNISFHFYGANQNDLAGFQSDAQRAYTGFSTNAECGEFNLVTDAGSLSISPDNQEIQMNRRIAILQSIGYSKAYFFVLKKDSSNCPLMSDDGTTIQQYYYSLISGRRSFLNQ